MSTRGCASRPRAFGLVYGQWVNSDMPSVCEAADAAQPNQTLSVLLAAIFCCYLLTALSVSLVQLAPDVLMPLIKPPPRLPVAARSAALSR